MAILADKSWLWKVAALALTAALCAAAYWIGLGVREAANAPAVLTNLETTVQLPPFFCEDNPLLVHDFVVHNCGSNTIRFLDMRNSCACSRVALADRVLEPGQTTSLRVEVNPHGRFGRQNFSCELIDDHGAVWRYLLQTTIVKRVALDPTRLAFGHVQPSTQYSRKAIITLAALPGVALPMVICARPASDQLTATLVPCETPTSEATPGTASLVLNITLLPQTVAGMQSSTITLLYDFNNATHEVVLPVSWYVASLFTVSPSRVFFGTIQPNTPHPVRKVTVRRTDGQQFLIRSVTSEDRSVTCHYLPNAQSAEHELTLQCEPTGTEPFCCGVIVVRTDHDLQPVISIPFAGRRVTR